MPEGRLWDAAFPAAAGRGYPPPFFFSWSLSATASVSCWEQRPGGYSGLSPPTQNVRASVGNSKVCQHGLSSGSLRATFSTAICSLSPLWTMSLFSSPRLSLFIQSPPASLSSFRISPLSHPSPSLHCESSVP